MGVNYNKRNNIKSIQSNNEIYHNNFNGINDKYLENKKENQNNILNQQLNESTSIIITNLPIQKKNKYLLKSNLLNNAKIISITKLFRKSKRKIQLSKRTKTKNRFTHLINKLFLLCLFIICLYYFQNINNFGNNNTILNKNTTEEININNINNTKKLIYTVIIGKYDKLKKITRQDGWDYYAFIEPNIYPKNSTNWTILPFPEHVKNLPVSKIKKQRYIKIHPHLFFQNYSLSIYIDGSIGIIGDLNEFVIRILKPNFSIFMVEHPYRYCIYQEIKEVVIQRKENKYMSNTVYNNYVKENFPHKLGLVESNVMIRKHNKNESIELMEKWWNEINKYSHRDQLSFNYLLWKTGIKIKYFSKFILYDYFTIDLIHISFK